MDRGNARMKRGVLLREPIGVALETLRTHKMRSFLMLLGIILSVSTLIVVIALISGVNRYIADRVANLGSNVFLLTRFPLALVPGFLVPLAFMVHFVSLWQLRRDG